MRGKLLSLGFMALVLTAGPGCLCFVNSLPPCPVDRLDLCQMMPWQCRSQVYVFLINGLDPCCYGNLIGLRDRLHEWGFTKTYYGQLYHGWYFLWEMERLHREQPDARFVVMGFDCGANEARRITRQAANSGVPVDLLVYLDGQFLADEENPPQAGRVLSISGVGCLWDVPPLAGAVNVRIEDAHHYDLPAHPATLEMISNELAAVAGQVTYVRPLWELDPDQPFDPAPTPRKLAERSKMAADEWDFLRPADFLDPTRVLAGLPQPEAFESEGPTGIEAAPAKPQPFVPTARPKSPYQPWNPIGENLEKKSTEVLPPPVRGL